MTDAAPSPVPARDPYRTALEVGAILASSLDLDEVFRTIARQVGEALDVQWCDIHEYDAAQRTLTYAAVWSEELRDVDWDYLGTVVKLDERPGRGAVIRRGDLLETYLDDAGLDPIERQMMIEYDEKAVMEMPLVSGGETIGVLGVVESRRSRRFNEDEKRLFRLLARPAATAIGNARAYREQREQTRRTATLLDSSRAIAASVELDEVLVGVAQRSAEAVGVAYATVYEYHPHHDTISYVTAYSGSGPVEDPRDDALGTTYPLGDLPGDRSILAGARIVQQHISDPELSEDRRVAMEAWGQKTCLSLPLRFGGSPQGILRLTTVDAERQFSPSEIELLEALGELASAAIHNARLYREQAEQSKRLLCLFDVSRELTSTFDLNAIVAAVELGAGRLFGDARRGCLWLRGEADHLVPATPAPSSGASPAEPAPGLVLEALGALHPVENLGENGAGLAVPLAVLGRAEGVLLVEAPGRRRFSAAEREALQVLANQAAATLENVRVYRRVEQQAVHDGLTGLYNHRYFQERLRQECARARRYGTPLSLLMLDLDGFKSFNDRFGHQLGDEVLREVGEILLAETRRGIDLPARYGGEEFAVILPHTHATALPLEGSSHQEAGEVGCAPPPGAGALIVAARLRRAIAARAFAGPDGRRRAHCTVSIGVADLGEGDDPASALISAADAALYEGKRGGGDRVALAGRSSRPETG